MLEISMNTAKRMITAKRLTGMLKLAAEKCGTTALETMQENPLSHGAVQALGIS